MRHRDSRRDPLRADLPDAVDRLHEHLYVPSGMTGVVYEKFEPVLPGLFKNAVRKLGVVLVNVPLPLMYWPSELTIPTCTLAMLTSSEHVR